MTTTSQIRSWWGTACTGDRTKVALYGNGVVSVRDEIVDATHALSRCLEHYRYQSRAADTGAYNCRQITGGTGYSLHAYGIAIDINWLTNPYGPTLKTDMPPAMVAAIKAIRTTTGRQVWRWGGDYSGNKDAMHFEVVASPADLAMGIDPKTLPGAPTLQEDDMTPDQAQKLNAIDLRVLDLEYKADALTKKIDALSAAIAAKNIGTKLDAILAELKK